MTTYRGSRAVFHFLVLLVVVLALLPTKAHAFGAGSIPEYSYLHDKAFRHGDIGHILETIAKSPHRHSGGEGGLFNFFSALASKGISAILQGNVAATFSKKDVQRVYFGNWLRDYSQAIDVAGLSRMHFDELLIIVQILGFMTFGYATREYEITPERLGVYLPVEHIDNPRGYAEKEGDARKYHPQLRPPVDSRELEIDPRTGMKKYMATEGKPWDTSTAHIRRTLKECIEIGRQVHCDDSASRPEEREDPDESEDMWIALRLLGNALHTLEDLLAHSNWCEVALVKLGYKDVFCHVGDDVRIRTPNGLAPPLVTGSFGSADFLHSVLGEASDHLSTASVVDLTHNMSSAGSTEALSSLRSLISGLPEFLNPSEKNSTAESIEERAKEYKQRYEKAEAKRTKRATPELDRPTVNDEPGDEEEDDYPPETEAQAFIWEVLLWRDELVRGISDAIETIPGLTTLLEQITTVINQCVFTLLAPILIPIIGEVTLALKEESQAIIDTEDQYEVFDNPKASDPTHSIIAKDHVDLILNEPAGKIAQVVVEHTVGLVVNAWYERKIDVDKTIDQILEAFHHPYYATGKSKVQRDMLACLKDWLEDFGVDKLVVIDALTKQSVRDGTNKRIANLGHGYSDDTLSSLDGSDEQYGSAYDDSLGPSDRDDNARRSIDSRTNVGGGVNMPVPVRRPPERLSFYSARQQERYEDVLRDPRASTDAKRLARSQLPRERLVRRDDRGDSASAVPSTTGADMDSDEANDYGSDSNSEFSSLSSSPYGPFNGPSRSTERRREDKRRRPRGHRTESRVESTRGHGRGGSARGNRDHDAPDSSSGDDDAFEEASEGPHDTHRATAPGKNWWDSGRWI